MKNIEYKEIEINKEKRIVIIFEYNEDIIEKIRKIQGRKWDINKKYWHIPYSKENLNYLSLTFNIKNNSENYLEKFKNYLIYKRYSPNTINMYTNHIIKFKSFINKNFETVTLNDIIRYLKQEIVDKDLSESYQNQAINALKKFYKVNYNKYFDLKEIERPKKSKKLPVVLSQYEIKKLINSIENLKHKTIISLIYSSGLRISEAINIKLNDIDKNKMIITIMGAKGKKDRIVSLSKNLLNLLKEYYSEYRPSKYLFEGGNNNEKYTSRSIQAVFQRAKKKAGIIKKASVHSLRHSYATHLLESGVDLRIIQELLGHKSSKTTEIYTHVSNKMIKNVISPLDKLDL